MGVPFGSLAHPAPIMHSYGHRAPAFRDEGPGLLTQGVPLMHPSKNTPPPFGQRFFPAIPREHERRPTVRPLRETKDAQQPVSYQTHPTLPVSLVAYHRRFVDISSGTTGKTRFLGRCGGLHRPRWCPLNALGCCGGAIRLPCAPSPHHALIRTPCPCFSG